MEVLTLSNGLKVVLENRKGTGLVSIDASVNAGYAYEKSDKYGLSVLISKTLIKGTKDFSKQEILELTEGVGGEISASSDTEYSDVSLYFHSKNIDSQIKILASMLKNPLFDEDEIVRQKKSIKDSLKSIRDNPSAYISSRVLEYAFEGQVYANSPLKQEATIDNITREDMCEFFKKRYTAHNMVVSIIGDFDIDQVKLLCEENLSDIEDGFVEIMPKAESKSFYYMKEDNNVDQVNLKLCFNGVGWSEPDYWVYKLLISTLSGAMSSRMFRAMREEDQLVYSFSMNNIALYGGGLFCMNAGTGKGKTEILVPKAISEMKKFIETITDEEVEAAISSWEKRFKTNLYDLNATSSFYSYEMLKHGHIETSKTLQNKLRKITKEDLIRVAYQVLNSPASFIGVGPKEGVYSLKEIKDMRAEALSAIDMNAANERAEKTALSPRWLSLSTHGENYGEYKKSVLNNGLTVITQYRPDALVACGYWVGAGCENETKSESGISHMLEHMVFKGTSNFKNGEIDKIIENKLYGYLNAFTAEDKTCYYSYNISTKDVDQAMFALGDMIFNPTLSDVDFNGGTREDGSIVKDGEKEVVFEEINRANDTPINLLWYNLKMGAFGDTSLGGKVLGTKESLTPMAGETLKNYHDKWYVPNNVTFLAVGELDHDEAVSKLEELFGDIPAVDFEPIKEWDYVGEEINTSKPEKEMSFVGILYNAVPEKSAKTYQYHVLASILGEGKSSKLYSELVDNKQLTNNVMSECHLMKNAGIMMVIVNCKHENVSDVKDAIFNVLDNATISEEDLKKAVLKIKMDKKSEMLSPSDAFVSVGYSYVNTGVIETIEHLEEELDKITVADVNELLKSVVESKPTVSVVGKVN